MKGICVFLSEKNDKYTYDDVRRLYKDALFIDDEFVTALLELGHHYYASESKSNLAVPLFEKAIKILTDQLTDAVTGLAKCIEELDSSSAAINYLDDIKKSIIDNKKINDLKSELKGN